jgi:MFS family permease
VVRLLPVRLAGRHHRQAVLQRPGPGSAFIFALLAFAAGFIVRPFGALVFGRLGDMIGRKYTFLVTILIMGLSTFIVGILPNYATIGVAAPVILIVPAHAAGPGAGR